MQVSVEVDVVLLLAPPLDCSDVRRLPELREGLDGRLVAQVLVDRRRQGHAQAPELLRRVPAPLVGGRVAEHIVWVDEREDEAEGLRELRSRKPCLHLPGVILVPAFVRGARVATAERLGFRVAARVGGLPVREAVVALDALRVRGTPLPALDRLGEVPLAFDCNVVTAFAQQCRERVDPWRQLGLVAALGTEPEEAAGKGESQAPTGCLTAGREARDGPQHVGQVARVG